MLNQNCVDIVKQMLEVDEIPDSLMQRLVSVEKLIQKSGGSLYSRQVIATIVSQWGI